MKSVGVIVYRQYAFPVTTSVLMSGKYVRDHLISMSDIRASLVYYDKDEDINAFDALIFMSHTHPRGPNDPDVPEYVELIGKIDKPFVVWLQKEAELSMPNYLHLYLNNAHCVGIVSIDQGIAKLYSDTLLKGRKINDILLLPCYPRFGFFPHPKSNWIVSTSNLAPHKHIEGLINYYQELIDLGAEVRIYGAIKDKKYYESFLGGYKDYQIYRGVEKCLVDVLSESRFHYNGTLLRNPRFSLVTVEAMQYGCLPILQESFVPSWYNGPWIPVHRLLDEIEFFLDQDLSRDVWGGLVDIYRHANLRRGYIELTKLLGIYHDRSKVFIRNQYAN